MRAVIQRVIRSSLSTADGYEESTGHGIVVFIGIEKGDSKSDIDYISGKIARLRIFEDQAGKLNRSIKDTGGEIMLVSQFTLLGDCRKGTRPSFDRAEYTETALHIYKKLVERLVDMDLDVKTGKFGEFMSVNLVNSGPVTVLIDSRKLF